MPRLRTLLTLVTCALGCCSASTATAAQAETVAVIKPSFSPDRLGATSALTFALDFSGEHEAVPSPVRKATVHLPAGLGIGLRRVAICPLSRLRAREPSGCPHAALVGRGHSLMEARLGALTLPETATLQAFRGPDRGGRMTLEISGQGLTPLVERITFVGVFEPDRAPYGMKLQMSIPPIPTLPTEPDASTVKFSLTLGSPSGSRSGAIKLPGRCPGGGFPFAAEFGFADGTSASASAQAPCP